MLIVTRKGNNHNRNNEWYLILVEERWACCESRAWKEAGIQVPQMFWIKILCNF